jgi:hypothetical protein
MKTRLFMALLALTTLGCSEETQSSNDLSSTDSAVSDVASDTKGDASTTLDGEGDAGNIEPINHDLSLVLENGEVRAGVIDDPNELLSGPKAEGRTGDLKIYNAHVAFVIEGVRRAGGYRYWGGHPIDVASIVDGEPLPDTYGEFFRSWNFTVFEPQSVTIVDDGSLSGEAHIQVKGTTGVYYFAEHFLTDILTAEPVDFEVVYDYKLGAQDRALRLDTSLQNRVSDSVWVDFPLLMSNAGDGAYPYTPGLGFVDGEVGAVLPYFLAGSHRQAYAWINDTGGMQSFLTVGGVTLLTDDTYKVLGDELVKQTVYLAASPEGPAGIERIYREIRAEAAGKKVTGTVVLPATAEGEEKWVAALAGDTVASIAPVQPDGSFSLDLDEGAYTLQAFVRRHAASESTLVNVGADGASVELTIPEPARVAVTVVDRATGKLSPSRIIFDATGGTPSSFAPDALRPTDKFNPGNRNASIHSATGSETALLPAGSYTVIASRGFSYEYEQRTVTLVAGENEPIAMEIERVVDTTGWLSADFHIHALWSPDSYVPYDVRVLQAIANDLDLPILTEHVYAGGLGETIKDLGVEDLVHGIVGQEVTTFVFGHFNAFPLVWDPSKPNMGAVFPFDKEAPELFDAIRSKADGDVVIQVNHPRGSAAGAYFSFVGLDAEADTVKQPDHWSTNWEAIEVFNGSCNGGSSLEEVADWIGLTNHGYRKTLASGSDVHKEAALPGTPRNWIRVDRSDVLKSSQNLVPAVRERNLFVSCGPFIRFTAVGPDDTEIELGQMVASSAAGEVTFNAKVEAPSWIKLAEVRLWENGKVVDAIDISTPLDPVVRLEHSFTVSPEKDAWYALEVVGTGTLWPVDNSTPYALTNAIEVDADGDGVWTPPGKSSN